jgi:hypothetical protein
MNRFILALLALCGLCSGADAKRAIVGGVAIELPSLAGYCELDENHPSDRRHFDLMRKASPATRMLSMSADCRQLSDWRAGRRPTLANYAQYQTISALENGPLPLPPAQLIRQTCAEFRSQGGDLTSQSQSDIQRRLEQTRAGVKLNQMTFMGVLGEDPNACYASLLGLIRAEDGTEVEQATVFALTVVRGKAIYAYLFARFEGGQTLAAMLAQLRVDVAALEAANRN